MRSLVCVVAALATALAVVGCEPIRPGARRGGADGGSDQPDADGDGIGDSWEGARDRVDTDGDGTPDYLDEDSDNDGIADSIEGYPNPTTGEPADSDGDGIYDFRDDDSDGNGIPDADEPDEDLDGDGHPAFRDLDDDGDLIDDVTEIGPDPFAPVDTDGDGIPDYRDLDSDNDTIADLHEGTFDTDRDGTPDRHDADSDNDGWSDAEEAGDDDVATPPVDTDGDFVPDFRDADSDGDGLSDADERTHRTNPRSADTDGDGVSDLVEISACPDGDPSCANDATDPTSNPRSRGDFVFLEPFAMPPTPGRDTLDFATNIRQADVYFLVDTTGSMSAAINSLKADIAAFIPMVRAAIPDVYVGVGGFDDYPVGPYGGAGDRAYYNEQDLTDDIALAQAGADRLTTHWGYDDPESHIPALWAVITGSVLPGTSGMSPRPTPCPPDRFGYPCFRSGAVPIIILISDVRGHNGPGGTDAYNDVSLGGHAPTYAEAIAALTAANARVIGIGQGMDGRSFLESVARDTGAVDATGAPLYSTWSSGGIGATVLTQIETMAAQTRFDISVEFVDDPADGVDTWAAFVDHIEANTAGDPARGCVARTAVDTDGDVYPDMFPNVTAGERVCFDIVVRENTMVMPTSTPQLFRATLRVLGDGFTELDSRDVFFLVPAEISIPGIPD